MSVHGAHSHYLSEYLEISRQIFGGMGIQIDSYTLYSLNLADDQVILAEDREDLYATQTLWRM